MSSSPSPPASPTPTLGPTPLRIVLFGMPDAGKSSLLGALNQSAQMQDRALRGWLSDLSQGLAELQRRLYDERQTETREEIVPYPIVFEPYAGTGMSRLDAVIYDCDGRVANDLLAERLPFTTNANSGSLADAVLIADALVLVVDASASNEQIEIDFRESVHFLQLLETHRSHTRAVGGFPVYLALTKCDLLARPPITRAEWETRVEARRVQVRERFARYLEGNASGSLLSFGSIDLHVMATAVKRPELVESAAHPREPVGVADLFHDCLGSANAFRRRINAAHSRLKWTLVGVGGFIAVAASVALFLLASGGPVEQPYALIERVEQFQANDKPLPDRLTYDVLQKRYELLTTLRNDPAFDSLPEDKKNYIRGRLDELLAYQEFVERLTRTPFPERARTLADLGKIEAELKSQATVPFPYQKDWEKTHAVLERQRRIQECQQLRTGVEELRNYFDLLKTRADKVLFDKDFHALWKQQADAVFEQEKSPPFPRGEGVRSAAFEFDETLLEEKEWRRSRQKLEAMRDLASALGLIGDPAAACLEIPATLPDADLNRLAAVRLERLRKAYPNLDQWSLAALPDPLQTELRKKLQRAFDQLVYHTQQKIAARLRQSRPAGDDSPRDWKEIAEWLASPAVRELRDLLTFIAQRLDPNAEDPVASMIAFLQKPSVELQIKSLTLTLPNNLSQGPFVPGEELYVFLRPQGASTARTTLTFRIDRSLTKEETREKLYRYKLMNGDGTLNYKPLDEFGAELNLKKGDRISQLIWSNARTATYALESILREPLLTTADAERGTPADGVSLSIDGKFPKVPILLPDLRHDKK